LRMGFRRDRAGSSLQSRLNLQLRQNALHVLSHRFGRDRQVGSDLLAVTPDDEKLEHPLLLLGQPFGPWRVQSRLLALSEGACAQTDLLLESGSPCGAPDTPSASSALLSAC